MGPLPEEAADAPAATAAPAAAKTDIPQEVKKPSGWKLFATVSPRTTAHLTDNRDLTRLPEQLDSFSVQEGLSH